MISLSTTFVIVFGLDWFSFLHGGIGFIQWSAVQIRWLRGFAVGCSFAARKSFSSGCSRLGWKPGRQQSLTVSHFKLGIENSRFKIKKRFIKSELPKLWFQQMLLVMFHCYFRLNNSFELNTKDNLIMMLCHICALLFQI